MSPRKNREWVSIPPWIIIGAVILLAPIFIFVALETISTQKENTQKLLVEKGAALIRSFEAGTRTGIMEMRRGALQLQRLLTETAQQSDIIYLFITDDRGTIVAHNDPSKIGTSYGEGLELDGIAQSKSLRWRQVDHIFEVYRKFSPLPTPSRRNPAMRAHEDWFRSQFGHRPDEPAPPLIIFVGLDMKPIEEAMKEDTRRAVVMAVILLLIGFTGFISLFLAQGYRSARTSLSRIRAFSENLVAHVPIGLLAFDKDRHITSLNETAASLLRLTPERSMGNRVDAVIPEGLAKIIDLIMMEGGVIEREIECEMAGGSVIPLEVIATQFMEDDDRSPGYIVLFRDLTEIQHLRQEIDRSRRLASIGRLAAGVAHEIRNPLSSIKGFATYFRERYRDVPEDEKTADIMVQEVDRLNRVISQLLEFARPMNIQLQSVALIPFIQRSLTMVASQASDRNITIVSDLPPEGANLSIDPDRISQVLLNLYLNAFDAMEGGGTLSVKLAVHDEKRVKIEISDTGHGIEAKDMEKIFDPYFTTKSSGTGLGLAIVHRIVEAHGGEIRVQSETGQGTTVSVILPTLTGERYITESIESEDLKV